MNGFIVTHQYKNNQLPDLYEWKPLFDFQPEHRMHSARCDDYYAEQFTADNFHRHKFFIENDHYLLITEGLITNIQSLYDSYQCSSAISLFPKMASINPQFFSELNGNFAGYFYDKRKKKVTVFNNQTGTRKLFYFKNERFFIVSTDLHLLSQTLKKLSIERIPDEDAMQMLLSYGFMLEDYTLIKEIKQITAGQYLQVDDQQTIKNWYFHLKDIQRKEAEPEQLIIQLEESFRKALQEEYKIDQEYSYPSFATLSGGLDSRMTVLMAHQLGYEQQLINFSQKGYADEVIAHQIANHYQLKINHLELTEESLTAIDDIIRVNDGLTLYSGAGHALQALRQLSKQVRGILHTGMLGDAILGSYLSAPTDSPVKATSGAYTTKDLEHSELFAEIASKYPNEELFKFYNRAFQGINNGYLYLNLFSESLSPFMHPDFIRLALSIPRRWMYKEKLYIQWIRKIHPAWANFSWENIGGRPTTNKLIKIIYRIRRAILKRIPLHSMWKNSMTPEQHWYDSSEKVRHILDNYFDKHIEHPVLSASMRDTLKKQYSEGNITSKTQVLTFLGAVKQLFR